MVRLRTSLAIVVLSLAACGCRTALTEGGRLSLPTFGAPEQWEPQVESTAAEPTSTAPKAATTILGELEQDR